MSLYNDNEITTLYGHNYMGSLHEPILYLLNRELVQDQPKVVKEMMQDAVKKDQALEKEIKSKFNILKAQEGQSVSGGFRTPSIFGFGNSGGYLSAPNKGGYLNAPNKSFKFAK